MEPTMPNHSGRKADHLDLCASDQVAFKAKTTLLEQVQLVHDALPELAVSDIDLTTELCGRSLQAPLVISAMTGGVDRAEVINRDLAQVAQELGLGFGFGSMRPLLDDPKAAGYRVREVAPDQQIVDLIGISDCNALCVHLNPAMEVIQPGGDNDFRGGLDTLARLHEVLNVPVIVKETGCGLSRGVGQRVAALGIQTVDVSGAGGTSWVGVETLRARAATQRLGELYWDWGIPTGASVLQLQGLGLEIIATGGVRNGLDVARALALGATAGGIARGFLIAWNDGGQKAAHQAAAEVISEIRLACLLTGSRTPQDLAKAPKFLGPELAQWRP